MTRRRQRIADRVAEKLHGCSSPGEIGAQMRRESSEFKLAHAEAMLRKANTRAKRAATLLRKWIKEVKRLEKLIERQAAHAR